MSRDLELMLICAMRYAIGRETYMPSVAIDYLRYIAPQLSANTLFILQRDIEEEIERYKRIDHEMYMADEWLKLKQDISSEYEKKKAVQE